MKHFILFYEVVPDYLDRRQPYRTAHLALAKEAFERGELLMGGAYADPADGAVLIWRCEDRAPIERFVASDPYVKNGVVTKWRIREWNEVVATVVGAKPDA